MRRFWTNLEFVGERLKIQNATFLQRREYKGIVDLDPRRYIKLLDVMVYLDFLN